jgi:ElaB/YqjD/DUF883 family membrane-anchored ribosome-binding protein
MERQEKSDGSEQTGPTLGEASEQLMGNFTELREMVAERTEELRETVTNFVQERPLASVGIAFGVGYLLSGALYSRTTGRLLGLGSRFLIGALLKQAIAGGGLGALAAMVPERTSNPRRRS